MNLKNSTSDLAIWAVRGKMGETDYYLATMPLIELAKRIRLPDWRDLDPEERMQRKVVSSRVTKIAEYISQNQTDYLFPPITVIYENKVEFHSSKKSDGVGYLMIESEADIYVLDGQHRWAAIHKAIQEGAMVNDDQIGVLFIEYIDTERSQQIFADFNRHAIKPPKPLNILYDHRDLIAELVVKLLDAADHTPTHDGGLAMLSRRWVDRERSAVPKKSEFLFSLAAVYDATELLLGHVVIESDFDVKLDFAKEWWHSLLSELPKMRELQEGTVSSQEVREEYIFSLSPVVWAFGYLGCRLTTRHPDDWRERLANLSAIDWRKSNEDWQNIILSGDSVLNKVEPRRDLAVYIMDKLHVRLSEDEQKVIEKLRGRGRIQGNTVTARL